MKSFKDLFVVVVLVVALVWLITPQQATPTARAERPIMSAVWKVAKFVGVYWLMNDEPPLEAEPRFQEALPSELVNEPPIREPDPDGVVHLDHGQGW